MKKLLIISSIFATLSIASAFSLNSYNLSTKAPKLTDQQRAKVLEDNKEIVKMADEDDLARRVIGIRKAYKEQLYGDERRDELVAGAEFIDWFTPIPNGKVTSDTWGDVVPRNVDNGLEDANNSFWGGNIVKGDDGKYHMFACGWDEKIYNSPAKQGHNLWWASTVTHSISDNPTGPYKVVDMIGRGHNPEIYRKKNGSYIIGVMGGWAYTSTSLNGPWTKISSTIQAIDESRRQENRTYIVRDDDSVFMLNKEGYLFETREGKNEYFYELDLPTVYKRVYPKTGQSGDEDPVMWKDEVNYNVIANSPYIPEAYLFTSSDGKKWKREEGVAFTNRIVKHSDGTVEKWRWLERPKVLLDEYGRVTHMNFAAIDVLKQFDLGNDNHGSKNVVVPMTVNKRLQLVSKGNDIVKIKIISEKGFNANKDIDIASLRFGNFTKVNFGGGAKAIKSYSDGNDLIVEFKKSDMELTEDDYKAKMLGKLKNKNLMWGKVRLTALPKPY